MKKRPLSHYLVVIFCLALVGWVLDSLFLSSSDLIVPQDLEASTTIEKDAVTNEVLVAGNPVVAKLVQLRDSLQLDPTDVKNVFIPSAAWRDPEANMFIVDPIHLDPTAFAFQYRLLGVVVSSKGNYANVNGEIVMMGQKVGGYRLVNISNRSATFERDNRRVELYLTDGGQ